MLDTDLLVNALRKQGFLVESVHKVPENAGEYEFMIGGQPYSLEQARELLEQSTNTGSESRTI